MRKLLDRDSEPRRALVLSGGGGRGAFECGVVEKLEELGWRPDVLVGNSIGSMNAAVWALDGTEGLQRMWSEVRSRNMHRFLRLSPWRSLLDRGAWKQTLERYADEERLKQAETPLYIVTMDIKTGHPVVYTNSEEFDTTKKLYRKVDGIEHKHLLASSSIPYVYTTTEIGGIPHWDGAVMYNSPLQPAVDSGADQIMVVLLSPYHDLHKPEADLPAPPGGIIGKVGHLLDLVMVATFENDFEQMRKVNRRVRKGQTPESHREIEAALIGPQEWLPVFDIIRYRGDRIEELQQKGREAAETTWSRIEEYGWDSLYD
jgi:NTE family protein